MSSKIHMIDRVSPYWSLQNIHLPTQIWITSYNIEIIVL
jgi:hypothetical protein